MRNRLVEREYGFVKAWTCERQFDAFDFRQRIDQLVGSRNAFARDALQSFGPDNRHINSRGGDQQTLIRTNVRCRFTTANMLFARLQRERESLLAVEIHRATDNAAGHLRYANAGHPRPLHLSVAEDCVRPLPLPAAAGPALGLFGEAKYITGQCPISVGDRVLFFTDGLIEIAGAGDGKVFGPPQLLAATRARLRLPTEQLLDDLIAEARGAAGGAEFDDDLCLLAMGRAA